MGSKKFWTENKFASRFILFTIILNSVIIFLQESGYSSHWLNLLDMLSTLVFTVEMVGKHRELGFKGYWSSAWNIMDGTLVILSIPSLISYFVPTGMMDLSILLILRVLRVFRFFRLMHIFPHFEEIVANLWKALKDSFGIFVGFLILIVVFALFSCALFKDVAPEYFATPWDSIYSTFRLCTVEGWYDIPDTVIASMPESAIAFVRVYFVLILVAGGIIGLSLVNSIFVDAMVSDNNNRLEDQVKELTSKIETLTEQIARLQEEKR